MVGFDGDNSGDDALFAEVLALLSDESSESDVASSSPVSTSSCTPRRASKKPYAIGSAARRKIALDALRIEERELNEQLTRLRGALVAQGVSYPSIRERVAVERAKRRRSEQECKALRAAVYQQTQFLRGLQGVFALGPETPLTLNLCHHLHTFTRLPRDVTVRQEEYNLLTSEERLHAAMELLCRETERISISDSYIETDYEEESDEACAVTTKSVFVLDDSDVSSVLQAACVAIRDIVVRCRAYECVGLSGEIVDAETLSERNLQYRVTNIRRKSTNGGDDFSVESRAVTMYKMMGAAGVVLWDFVDVDELHALQAQPDLSRQSVGACLIQRETCPDGVVRTVFREVSTRRYEYRGHGTPSRSVAQYLESMRLSMRSNELLFRDIMIAEIN